MLEIHAPEQKSPGARGSQGFQKNARNGENLTQRLAVTRLTFGLVDDPHHGAAFATKNTFAGLGKTAAFDGRTAGAIDSHVILQKVG
jgi:hypothetical protein